MNTKELAKQFNLDEQEGDILQEYIALYWAELSNEITVDEGGASARMLAEKMLPQIEQRMQEIEYTAPPSLSKAIRAFLEKLLRQQSGQ